MSFYRQGAWMVTATTLAGLFMFAVHLVPAPWFSKGDYSHFYTMIMIVNFSMIPALGLQTVFAHEAAAVRDEAGQRCLAGNTMGILALFTGIWAAAAALIWLGQERVLQWLKLEDAWGFWVTLCAVLPHFWLPVFCGILQGRQWFGWLGCAIVSNGLGRFLTVALVLVWLGPKVHWLMLGALAGVVAAVGLAVVPCRGIWARGADRIQWRAWFGRALLFALGPGMVQFMLTVDMIVARGRFEKMVSDDYAMAGVLGRGLFLFVGPIAGVMFPKLVNPSSKDSGPKLVSRTFWATLVIVGLAAALSGVICWDAAPAVLQSASTISILPAGAADWLLERKGQILRIARLVPYFFGAMGLLALANVFVNHLVANREFGKVACLLPVPAIYGLGLVSLDFSPTSLVLWVGMANAGMLLAAGFLSRRLVVQGRKGRGRKRCETL